MDLKLNTRELVQMSVVGEINHPTLRKTGYVINSRGKAEVYPSVGGISYNVRIGMPAVGWMADHVEPGVSILNSGKSFGEYSPNGALNVLACIGNQAQVISGEGKGSRGFVTGKHGGIDHVLIDFEPEILEQLTIGDKILIKAFGVGLQLSGYFPGVLVMNTDPELLRKIVLDTDKKVKVAVSREIPMHLLGSGIGSSSVYSGDCDIQVFDDEAIKKYNLNELKLGDIISISDCDASHGWIYRKNHFTIGVIAHSNSVTAGHGPGVTTLMTAAAEFLEPEVRKNMNLIHLFYEK
ncbi:MAG: DUF4438 domain-containing protein [Calditrichia bacterium]